MKRLYVRPGKRGVRLGRMVDRIISEARAIGYHRMCVWTHTTSMREAIEVYRWRGFQEIAPFRANPIAGALYLELELDPVGRTTSTAL